MFAWGRLSELEFSAISGYISGNGPRTKAVKNHRKRLRSLRMKRLEVTVREEDAALLRRLATQLRRADENAERLRVVLRGAVAENRGPTIAEALYDPVIAGPEFDEVFEEIERFRHHPVMMQVRDVEL